MNRHHRTLRTLLHVICAFLAGSLALASSVVPSTNVTTYPDGRPSARFRLDAKDAGPVYRHGSGPNGCDRLTARDVWVFESGGTYYMHYDGAGPRGWLCCLATSKDLTSWIPRGPILDFGGPNDEDSRSASYGTTYYDAGKWHMFYLGTRRVTSAPNFIPVSPYLTMKAFAASPGGPWTKQPDVVPFRCKPGTYYSDSASPGMIVRQGEEYLMFFSAAVRTDRKLRRTLGIARTANLDAAWAPDAGPVVPLAEQIENSSLYFEPLNQTWFLFSNHIGYDGKREYTDAVWVYWSKDLDHWSADNKAVVIDGSNCTWNKKCIGLPSVIKVGKRLAILYDAPADENPVHMNRDIGLAWLDLPLQQIKN